MCILSHDSVVNKLIASMCSYEHLFPNVYFKYSKLVLYPYTIFPFQSHKSEATGFQSKIVLKIQASSVFWLMFCLSLYLVLLLNCNDSLSSASFRSFNIFKRKRAKRLQVSRTLFETWSGVSRLPKTPTSLGDGFEQSTLWISYNLVSLKALKFTFIFNVSMLNNKDTHF